MDMTPVIGGAAILFTGGIFVVLCCQIALELWHTISLSARVLLVSALAVGVIIAASNIF